MASAILQPSIRILPDIMAQRRAPSLFATLLLLMLGGASIYGVVLGMWRSPLLAAYVAVKMPLLFLVTALLTALINWMIAVLFGISVRLEQSVLLAFTTLAVTAVALASLAPIAWIFTISLPDADEGARTVHNLLYLTHTFAVGAAGIAGSATLLLLLREASSERTASRVYAAWLITFALVGGEVAWILRPFVGSVYLPVRFIREDALSGNIYQFIFTDILPHLLGGHR
jgi:hypothetical protein